MYKVSFNFDDVTRTISDMSMEPLEAPVKRKKKTVKSTDMVVLDGSSLKLPQKALDTFNASVGDRILIKVLVSRPEITLTKTDPNDKKSGNLITKSLSLSARGKVGEAIAKLGSEFSYKLTGDSTLVLTPYTNSSDDEEVSHNDTITDKFEVTKEMMDDFKDAVEVDYRID